MEITIPVNTKHLYNICTTSAQRLRRWSNIVIQMFCVYWDNGYTKLSEQFEDHVTYRPTVPVGPTDHADDIINEMSRLLMPFALQWPTSSERMATEFF